MPPGGQPLLNAAVGGRRVPRGSAEFLAEIRAGAVAHLRGDLAGGCPAGQQLGRVLDAHGGKFLHGRAVEPRAERLLQLGPRAAQRRADVVDLQFMHKIFGKIGAGVLDQRVLAALPPDAGHGALGAAAAAYNADEKELCRLDEIYSAAKTPFEIRSGSEKVTRRFFKICNNGRESFTGLYKSLTEQGICKGHQCIAYGLYMRDNGIELSEGLAVYGYSICSAIVTNCVKLVPLSQLAGQKILGESFELISSASEKALFTDINDIGISGAGFDLRAMQHERLYSRQYMS